MNSPLREHYEKHHDLGKRLRQSFLEAERAALFSQWLGVGKKVLDLGCRDGILSHHFMAGNTLVGGDIDTIALAKATEKYGFETHQVDLNTTLPFADGSFDAVIMAEVMEHLPYPSITLGEVSRILRPRGLFIGNVPVSYHLKDRYQVLRGKKLVAAGDPTHLQFFSYSDLLALLGRFFSILAMPALKGNPWARYSPRLFARNVAFLCQLRPAGNGTPP